MKKSGWRLAVSATLLAAWIGYLAYLAWTTTQPIVLSRPQFLVAELYVIAHVPADPADPEQPAKSVTVKQVVWAANPADKDRKSLQVGDMRSLKDLLKPIAEQQGKLKGMPDQNVLRKVVWDGPGDYILPLSHSKSDPEQFTITALPRTPGFAGETGRIYPATPATMRQLELLTKEYHP